MNKKYIGLAIVILICIAIVGIYKYSNRAETPSFSSIRDGISIQDNKNNQTVDAKVGQVVQVLLSGTDWKLTGKNGTANPSILSLTDSSIEPAVPGGCVDDTGCGTFIVDFTALGKGTTKIEATRTMCGETRKCTTAESKFTVTIVIR